MWGEIDSKILLETHMHIATLLKSLYSSSFILKILMCRIRDFNEHLCTIAINMIKLSNESLGETNKERNIHKRQLSFQQDDKQETTTPIRKEYKPVETHSKKWGLKEFMVILLRSVWTGWMVVLLASFESLETFKENEHLP